MKDSWRYKVASVKATFAQLVSNPDLYLTFSNSNSNNSNSSDSNSNSSDSKGEEDANEKEARLIKYLKRQAAVAPDILEKVYLMYPVKNAWSKVCFGANLYGIYRASLDEPMHYLDSITFLYLAQVAFLSMTDGELLKLEEMIHINFKGKRSSVRHNLPRGKFSSGFSWTTLLTAGEKVGLIFSLFATLGISNAEQHYSHVIGQIQSKYLLIPTPGSDETKLPSRGDVHLFSDVRQRKEGQAYMP